MTITESDRTPDFEYQPLESPDSIRLLHLQPSTDRSSPVVITLSEARLDDGTAYEALSYTWGDKKKRRDVLVISQEGDAKVTKFSVTANCHSALFRLRLPETERLLWVDAICINQIDIAERNGQVPHMGKVYSSASQVIVDVGEQSERSSTAIDFIANFYHQTHTDDPEHNRNYQDIRYDVPYCYKIRDIVAKFYDQPWFSRVWVLQEVFLARSAQLLCGDKLTDWSVFRPFRIRTDIYALNGEKQDRYLSMPSSVPFVLAMNGDTKVWTEKRKYTGAKGLLELLGKTRNCRATDPRDKVFALLSMVDLPHGDEVAVQSSNGQTVIRAPAADYNKDIAEVYTETAAWLIQRAGISLLSHAGSSQRKLCTGIPGLPSWVPNWSDRYYNQYGGMINNPTNPVYYPLRACGDMQTPAAIGLVSVQPSISALALQLSGRKIDTIHLHSRDLPIDENVVWPFTPPFVSSICSHRDQLTPSQRAHLPSPPYWTRKTGATEWHLPNWAAYVFGLPLKNPSSMTDYDVWESIFRLSVGRQLMVTKERGYVGIVPGKARQGDMVVVFEGGVVPFILRKVDGAKVGKADTSREYWKLIGEAYVYGLMDGEAFKAGENTEENAESEVSRGTRSRDFVII
ncbi:heterokaryon incompatibility domain containing protein [Naviculisporaceae sp. PSN 640]